jgi:hypothetical protein
MRRRCCTVAGSGASVTVVNRPVLGTTDRMWLEAQSNMSRAGYLVSAGCWQVQTLVTMFSTFHVRYEGMTRSPLQSHVPLV